LEDLKSGFENQKRKGTYTLVISGKKIRMAHKRLPEKSHKDQKRPSRHTKKHSNGPSWRKRKGLDCIRQNLGDV